jgi:hypothetical protein
MSVEKLSFVLPVDDLDGAVAFWKDLLGVDPTFVDGDRWAQFDHAGSRLALAGKDRASDSPGVMLKVSGLEALCDALRGGDSSVSEIVTGAHERRSVVTEPGGSPVVLYEPLPR